MCTDGLANIGLGSMDTDDGAKEDEAEAFYRRVALYAKDNGVVVNVISIKGTTCSMENLGMPFSSAKLDQNLGYCYFLKKKISNNLFICFYFFL